jgi:hypothetical protein
LVKSCFERDQTKRPTSKSIFKGLERILDEYRCLEQGEWDTKTSRWAREPANPYRFLRRHLKGTWPDKKVFQRSADRFLEKQQSDMAEAKRLDDLVTVTEPEALVRILEPSDRGSEHPLYTPTANDKKRSHGRSQGQSGKMGVCFSWRDRKWCRHGNECRYRHAENASNAYAQSRAYDQKRAPTRAFKRRPDQHARANQSQHYRGSNHSSSFRNRNRFHRASDSKSRGSQSESKRRPCHNWRDSGSCRFGNRCHFSHEQ